MNTHIQAGWQVCPACRLPMPRERIVCATCGGIAPVEHLARYGLSSGNTAVRSLFTRLFMRRSDNFLWTCALVPFLLFLPTLALIVTVLRWPQTQRDRDRRNLAAITAAAIINIMISVVILAALSDTLFGFAAKMVQNLLQFFHPAHYGSQLHYI